MIISFQTQTLKHGSSQKCLSISPAKDKLLMEPCNSMEERQQWKFGSFNETKAREANAALAQAGYE